MSRRYRCGACRTAFLSHDDQAGRPVACPKCGAKQVAPAEKAERPAPAPVAVAEESVFVPSEGAGRRPFRRWVLAGLTALAVAAVAAVVAWPTIVRWWHPAPPDPVEAVASAYLGALAGGDVEKAQKLGTVELPPAIRSFRDVKRDPLLDDRIKGSFAPISAFHARLAESFDYDAASGRFTPKNALGPAADTLDALHEAKAKAEQEGLYKKMQSGNPEDLFDAAESLGKTFTSLAEGALAPRKLVPSYKQLVEDAKPPLPPAEKTLALDFGVNRVSWDALLKRPYATLKADGPFLLERAEVTASVTDALGSLGDPPTTLHLTLTRFRLEGIDTGWRVTATRREGQPTAPAPPSPAREPSDRYK